MTPLPFRVRFDGPCEFSLRWLILVVGLWWTTHSNHSVGGEPSNGVLRLRDGSQVQGEWQDSAEVDEWTWKSSLFETSMTIPAGACESFAHPSRQAFPLPDEFWDVRLVGGSVIRGTWTKLDARELRLQPLTGGESISLDRRHIREMIPRSGVATVVYQGPLGMQGWQDELGRSEAIDRQGALQLEGRGILLQDVGLPERSVTDLEVTWRGRANFGFQWGVRLAGGEGDTPSDDSVVPAAPRLEAPPEEEGPRGPAELRPFNLEVFRSELWALAETRRGLEKVQVQTLGEPGGRLALRIYLDQKEGRLVVTSPAGERLCDLLAAEPQRVSGTAIRLVNGRGSVRLEKLRIAHWDGVLRGPQASATRTPPEAITVLPSNEVEWSEESRQIIVQGDSVPQSLARQNVSRLVLVKGADREPERRLVVQLVDGTIWRAREGSWRDGNLVLAGDVVPEGLRIPRSAVWRLSWGVSSKIPSATLRSVVPGMLQTGQTALAGGLCSVRETPAGQRLEWEFPLGIGTALLRPDVAARIVLREVRNPRPGNRLRPGPAGTRPGAGAMGDPAMLKPQVAVHMASGEVLTAVQIEWQPGTLSITLPTGGKQDLADAELKGLELTPAQGEPLELNAALREALLTVPRLGQANPPTHLVRSVTGDYLRGQLVSLDETSLVISVRGREQTLPRTVVAAIVWLHPSVKTDREGSPAGPVLTRVQAFSRGTPGAVLNPDRLEGARLSGTNVVQEQVELDLSQLDALLLGDWWEQFPAGNDGTAWKLKPARSPRYVEDGESP